jgi:hypothetical protein
MAALTKALLVAGCVVVDVSELRLSWTPAVHVFASALTAGGGWPRAWLVLFGPAGSWPRRWRR